MSDPSKTEIIYDAELGKYLILEKMGNYYVKRPIYMNQEEYKEYKLKKDMLEYYKQKISATNSKKIGRSASFEGMLKLSMDVPVTGGEYLTVRVQLNPVVNV